MPPITTLSEVESNFAKVLCRKPELILSIPRETLSLLNPKGQSYKIASSMFELHKARIPLTLEAIALESEIRYDELHSLAIQCRSGMVANFKDNLRLIELYGSRRLLEESLQHSYRLLTMSDIFEYEAIAQQIKEDINAIGMIGTDSGTFVLGDIVEEYLNQPEDRILWRVPTGFLWVDRLTEGGIGQNETWIIYGPFKNGKTQVFRVILGNIAKYYEIQNKPNHIVHFAHDGGNKYRHGMYYLSMQIQKRLIQEGAPLYTVGPTRDGQYGDVSIVTTSVVDKVFHNKTLPFKLPDGVVELFHEERIRFQKKEGLAGSIEIFDASTIRHSISRLLALCEQRLAQGATIFGLDHISEIGEADDHMRNAATSQAIVAFAREHDCAFIVLSQVGQAGINQDQSDNNPHLQGGNTLVEKADMSFRVGHSGKGEKHRIKMTATNARFTEGGQEVYTLLKPYLASGLVIDDSKEKGR